MSISIKLGAVIVSMFFILVACGGSDSQPQSQPAPIVVPQPPTLTLCQSEFPPLLERSLTDREDDTEGSQLHFVYAIPSDGDDLELDTNGQLQKEIQVAQKWFQEQVGRCIRVDTYNGGLDVTFVRLGRTNQQIRDDQNFVDKTISLELESRGLDDPNKLYVVYYGGSADNGSCGGAAAVGGPAMQYLNRQTQTDGPLLQCPSFAYVADEFDSFRRKWAAVAMHETFHALGVVPRCAPDHDDAHPMHLETISSDLMAFDGSGFSVYTLDENRNQYYQHSNSGCLDLADSGIWVDAPPNADALPNRPVYTPPLEVDCANEGVITSTSNQEIAELRVVNMTAQSIQYYNIDAFGAREIPFTVEPFSEYLFGSTNVDRVFVATDAVTGECKSIYRLVSGFNRILSSDL